MVSVPEQRVTVRHPVLKAPPGEMRHTAEFMNRPRQTSHHGKSLCTCSRRSASLSRADHRGGCGPAPQSLPAFLHSASPPATSGNNPPAHRRYSRRENIFPPSGVLTTKPHDSAGAHRRACARIADSVSVMGLLRKFVNGKEAAKVADVIAKLTAAQAFAAFILRDIGRRLVIFIRDCRTVITALITAIGPVQVLASMIRPGKTAPSVSVGVDSTKEALTALSSLHCSMRQRLITSCSDRRHCFR